jgi:hypothetical protein
VKEQAAPPLIEFFENLRDVRTTGFHRKKWPHTSFLRLPSMLSTSPVETPVALSAIVRQVGYSALTSLLDVHERLVYIAEDVRSSRNVDHGLFPKARPIGRVGRARACADSLQCVAKPES